jgi:hypothetical protein
MSKLITLSQLNIDNFIDTLRDTELIVYENIQGTKVFFRYDGKEFQLKTRNLSTEPINKVDMALQKYFKPVLDYLESLDERIKKLLPREWWFCCQYFFDTQPAHVRYDLMPTNGLILSSIVKNNSFKFDMGELVEYADLLSIDVQPILFKGKLTEKQLDLITYFLNTSPNDLQYIFGEDNFASFFYKILNPQLGNSVLMHDGVYHDNLDKLIIKANSDIEMSFSVLNPLYAKNEDATTDFADTYSILIANFLEYLQSVDIEKLPLRTATGDEMYIEIICALFNGYCKNREQVVVNFEFEIPLFFHDDKYRLDTDLIPNSRTKSLINKHPKLEYMFKIVLSSFRTRKKKGIGVFNDNTLLIFNRAVDDIMGTIDRAMKIEREIALKADNLLNFSDFYSIQYPSDGADQVYPDLYKDLESDIDFGGSKKGKPGFKK